MWLTEVMIFGALLGVIYILEEINTNLKRIADALERNSSDEEQSPTEDNS